MEKNLSVELPADMREQLDAAWQTHVAELAEQLFGGWRSQVETVFAERLRLMESPSGTLNQSVRRLRLAKNRSEWMKALLDAAALHCPGAALFSTVHGRLRCEGVRGLTEDMAGLDIPLSSAPAFLSAVETQDPVIALASPAGLSETIAKAMGSAADKRAHLFPLTASGEVHAILYAAGVTDPGPLELLASIAGATLGQKVASGERRSWEALSKPERQLHLKAQRFAAVRVSEIRLKHAGTVVEGRAAGDVYAALKREIDAAREEFRRKFMDVSPAMVDYLHMELVRILTNNDDAQLGPDYPGPLA